MDHQRDLIDDLISDWRQERPDLDCTSMGVVGRIIYLGMLLRGSASAALVSHGLSYTDLDILATLRRKGAPFRLTPTELGDAVLLTSGAVTTAVSRLVDRGFVERGRNPKDGRVKTVSLTETGRALIDRAIEDRFREADDAISGLGEREVEALESILRRLILAEKHSGSL